MWETGHREPETFAMVQKISSALKCHPAWLMYGINPNALELAKRLDSLDEQEQAALMAVLATMGPRKAS